MAVTHAHFTTISVRNGGSKIATVAALVARKIRGNRILGLWQRPFISANRTCILAKEPTGASWWDGVSWNLSGGTVSLRRFEPSVMTLKYGKATVTFAQTRNPATRMLDHPSRLEHHRFDASAHGRMAHRGVGPMECVLSNQPQQIHRHSGELAHQVVGSNLPKGSFSKFMSALNPE